MPGRWVGMKVDLDLDRCKWVEEDEAVVVEAVEREREEEDVCDARCALEGDVGFDLEGMEGMRMVLWWKEPLTVSVS